MTRLMLAACAAAASVACGPARAGGDVVAIGTATVGTTVAKAPADDARDMEFARLRTAMRAEVPAALPDDADKDEVELGLARSALEAAGRLPASAELVLVVDRAPDVQEARVVLTDPDAPWRVVGTTKVSTGKPGRREHYRTPVGVFGNGTSILGYRAQGTYNQNHIRGLGARGMRVWDFGWQGTDDWRTPGAPMQVRLEMHATDPANLEHRIGRPDSEGCVRIPASLNRFLDRHGVIDRDLEQAAATDRRFAALLPRGREPTPLAGDLLVVVDSDGT